MERFLYRVSKSLYADQFILKGALMLNVWQTPTSRPTRDIDFLARMNNDVGAVVNVFREVCLQSVEPDGLELDIDSLEGQMIKEDADYSGVRVTFGVFLQNARVPMQIDIGFGDVVVPEATLNDYPTLLEFESPRLRTYPRETVVAEKLEAMVKLGQLNSRMKDFYDLWLLARQFDFDGELLSNAITQTFQNRQTALVKHPVALTPEFTEDQIKQKQWQAFLRKSQLETAPDQLTDLAIQLQTFLVPLLTGLINKQQINGNWRPGGPWIVD
ncbi:nucleotidyl transferase AbiEii/AbiGii toxin family protein [Gimesia sp.]|uniref:nucleotidyl transferase AbiEii/AbiGii toxin family protein n=1 Tax=Gimesia sp. TaxID=2024833 RepID=UPI003A915570